MFSRSSIEVAFYFAIISSIAATAGKFIDYFFIKTTTKYTIFQKLYEER